MTHERRNNNPRDGACRLQDGGGGDLRETSAQAAPRRDETNRLRPARDDTGVGER